MSNSNPDDVWQQELSATAGNTSAWLLIPAWLSEIVATVIPGGGGSATLQHTTATPEAVVATPSGVQAVNWDPGAVTVPTSKAAMGAVTAVRLSASVAAATCQIVGRRKRR